MDQIGVFTPEQARLLWQDYQTRQQLPAHLTRHYPERRPIEEVSPHRVFVKNDSGEIIPAYGCMEITGTEVLADRTVVTVTKPTTTDGEYLFNAQFAIAIGGTGWAYRYGVVVMLGDAPSAANVSYLPTVDEWTVEEGDGPFIVFGEYEHDDPALIGRFAGGGSASTAGTCPCTCIEDGDIVVSELETTSQWEVPLSTQTGLGDDLTWGSITLPGGVYVLTWDDTRELWVLDISGDLTAEYLDGSDATSATTMDGEMTIELVGVLLTPTLTLCVDGAVPEPP